MHSRPPAYYYGQAYVLVLAAVCSLIFGIRGLMWQGFLLALVLALIAIPSLAYLDWWRRNYDEWNPDEPDEETSRLNRTVGSWATQVVVAPFRRAPDR